MSSAIATDGGAAVSVNAGATTKCDHDHARTVWQCVYYFEHTAGSGHIGFRRDRLWLCGLGFVVGYVIKRWTMTTRGPLFCLRRVTLVRLPLVVRRVCGIVYWLRTCMGEVAIGTRGSVLVAYG